MSISPIHPATELLGECEVAPRALRFRPARPGDARLCAPLIFASGSHEFEFFLGVSPERCITFLAFAFGLDGGRFSWRRHEVAVDASGEIVAVLAAHDGRRILADDPHVVLTLVRHFGVLRTVPMLLRGLVLETELPKPKRAQTLVAHCATREASRGTGAFSALFTHALGEVARGLNTPAREIVLDVLVSNTRAAALYRRLGFVDIPRRKPRSKRLPAELESIRMRFEPRAHR
ncbi:GNAT family N-acetyltransferase [Paraburkholderia sp. Ac-20340]|uniref:GNAT family N-acetyltransferase n=1 Tax=Paraburkholderia sp. Ac-20340 TaxID=2703888 RepID=UPI001980EC7D|nr:GNAT family N-acetyltransferase [Paraburkholderia sp. Ac-20340]MBN3852498.1 GNAT family N-acetyltransferase [Paraburkholderia sp. Ac-20340]